MIFPVREVYPMDEMEALHLPTSSALFGGDKNGLGDSWRL